MNLPNEADELRKECTRISRLLDNCLQENKCDVRPSVISMLTFVSVVGIEQSVKYSNVMRDFRKIWIAAGGKIDES